MYWLCVFPAFTPFPFSRFSATFFIAQQTANFLEFVKRTELFSLHIEQRSIEWPTISPLNTAVSEHEALLNIF